jgi:hypothetical protein
MLVVSKKDKRFQKADLFQQIVPGTNHFCGSIFACFCLFLSNAFLLANV